MEHHHGSVLWLWSFGQHEWGQSGLIIMRHRKSPLHLRYEPPWLSPSGTLPVLDYLTGMTGAASAPLCPVSSEVGKKPPGDFSGSEAAGVDARKAGQLHVHPSSYGPMQTRKKSPQRRKWLKILINRLQEKPASASLCVAVSKHPSFESWHSCWHCC